MKRRFKLMLRNIYIQGIFLFALFIVGIKLTFYERMKTRQIRVPSSLHFHYTNKDVNLTSSSLIRTRQVIDQQIGVVVDETVEIRTKTQPDESLGFIPSVSESAKREKVPYLSDNIIRMYLKLPDIKYEEIIAILTPVRNSESVLERYGEAVGKLTYPHDLISLYFGEDGSTDNTFEEANRTAHQLKVNNNLNSAGVVKLNISGGYHGDFDMRHEESSQKDRRIHMALARNHILRFALNQNKFDYILWIDSDVEELPVDLVQQMLFAKSDVVATCCLMRSLGYKMKYDRNSWRETNDSLSKQSQLEPDYLVLEGYKKSLRISLPDLKSEGRVVPLDGVGGCALMIKAECHRSGLHFPEVVYKHHIETEGLAKMARDMGYSVVGLPFVEVFHR